MLLRVTFLRIVAYTLPVLTAASFLLPRAGFSGLLRLLWPFVLVSHPIKDDFTFMEFLSLI